MSSAPKRRWTDREDAILRAMVEAGKTTPEIGRRLGRQAQSCRNRAIRIGMSLRRQHREERERRNWKEHDDARLMRMIGAGIPVSTIAERMGRTELAVIARRHTIELSQSSNPAPADRRRKCMNCGHQFRSDGPHNRLCTACRGISLSPFDFSPNA